MRDLSVIIPCYNEEKVLESSLRRIRDLLRMTRLDFEIILIDDCSKDRTREILKEIAGKDRWMTCIFHEANKGRGATVAEGIRKAKGRVAGYIDIDLEIHENNILSHYAEIEKGSDVVYADRITPVSLALHPRTFLHFLYMSMTSLLLHSRFGDTNAGCKFFRREKILPVLDTTRDEHWFWDTEILFRSLKAGLKIQKIPVLYIRNRDKKSTVKVFSDAMYFFKKVLEFSREVKRWRS